MFPAMAPRIKEEIGYMGEKKILVSIFRLLQEKGKFFTSLLVLLDGQSPFPSLHAASQHKGTAKQQEAEGSAVSGHITLRPLRHPKDITKREDAGMSSCVNS